MPALLGGRTTVRAVEERGKIGTSTSAVILIDVVVGNLVGTEVGLAVPAHDDEKTSATTL